MSDTLQIGFKLNDEYEILSVLGSGGFGTTYLARDLQLNRSVAIKEYFPREVALREAQTSVRVKGAKFEQSFNWGLERFVQEARVLAKVRHPNIVRVFRTFDTNDTAYIVLDYVGGPDFESWLKQIGRATTQEEIDELLAPILDALSLLHSSGILHRDIKPANICIREETGDPVLVDFGASKYSMSEMTGTTAAIVSRGYSAYEAYAADSKSQGPWTDIYSLAATIHRALTGEPPPEAAERLLGDTFIPLASRKLQGFRPQFLSAVDWALGVQPKSRPQTVAEWQARLLAPSSATANWDTTRAFLDGAQPSTVRTSLLATTSPPATVATVQAPKRGGSGRFLMAAGILFVLAVAGGVSAMQFGLVDGQWGQLLLRGGEQTAAAGREPPTAPATEVPGGPEAPDATTTRKSTPGQEPAPTNAAVKMADAAPIKSALVSPSPMLPEYRRQIPATPLASSRMLTAASVSSDGRHLFAGEADGSIRLWDVETGGERTLGRGGAGPIVAVDFVGSTDVKAIAAAADGTISVWPGGSSELQTFKLPALQDMVLRVISHNRKTGRFVAVSTSLARSSLVRWPDVGEAVQSAHVLGPYMIRAVAIAKSEDLIVAVKADESIVAFTTTGTASGETFDWVKPAPEWTRALAISTDGRQLARGGNYRHVHVIDVQSRRVREIDLGDQPQTVALAFSEDGRRLAIAYTAVEQKIAAHYVRIVATETLQPMNNYRVRSGEVRWLSFLPANAGTYWLGLGNQDGVRVCEIGTDCALP